MQHDHEQASQSIIASKMGLHVLTPVSSVQIKVQTMSATQQKANTIGGCQETYKAKWEEIDAGSKPNSNSNLNFSSLLSLPVSFSFSAPFCNYFDNFDYC